MINSFYFIDLTSHRPINFDWGVVICCQLVEHIVVRKYFFMQYFLTIKQMILSKPRQYFWWLSSNQGQNN